MEPTNHLRFVEREVSVPWQSKPAISEVRKVHILQQKWVGFISTGPRKIDVKAHSEWRDVPVEKEQQA